MSDDLFSNLVPGIRKSSRHMVRELGFLGSSIEDLPISHSECHAMLELEQQGSLTIGEIAHSLVLDPSTVSRLVQKLLDKKWIAAREGAQDRRTRVLKLTKLGAQVIREVNQYADKTVRDALSFLSEAEQEAVSLGLRNYAKGLLMARTAQDYTLRRVQKKDNAAIRKIVFDTLEEYGAVGPGFASQDSELNDMYNAYQAKNHAYFVVDDACGKVVGCCGIAPLAGDTSGKICELRKMYFYPEVRGMGLGTVILNRCLHEARKNNFSQCYLETLPHMERAQSLYRKFGFSQLDKPIGDTKHGGCTSWLIKDLITL